MSATAFMPNLERILLAVDGGANGGFASRLAGLLAAGRKMPVTVLDLANNGTKTAEPRSEADIVRPLVAAAEEASAKKPALPEVDVIVRKHDVAPAEAIATEAERGYDLLMIGIDTVTAKGGGFHGELSKLVSQFEGSVAIVDARGAHREDPTAPVGISSFRSRAMKRPPRRRGCDHARTCHGCGSRDAVRRRKGRKKPASGAPRNPGRRRGDQEDCEISRDEDQDVGSHRR